MSHSAEAPAGGSEAALATAAPGAIEGIVPRPELFERLGRGARVTLVTAPAGSGKTVLLRSWIATAGLAGSAAWVSVQPDERDPQHFWLSLLDALRETGVGSSLVRELTAAPELDGWMVLERLLEDLDPLEEVLWLVIDDVHELDSSETLRQLELLLMRAPAELRFVLSSRRNLQLGLHRLRLAGGLAEIRAGDLRFTLEEARALLQSAGVAVSDAALESLHARTEGWAAGLRLAALSLAADPDPDRFAADFSGSERTVAEYLLAEVLDRQPEEVRRLLLRTSILERVSPPLADALLGCPGSERMLQELEAANAFVVSLDPGRSWFRYHRLFADLLRLQLRLGAPGELAELHSVAAQWYAGNGYPIEAIRHAQAAESWELAGRVLSDQWFRLLLDGQEATVHELLNRFPDGSVASSAELAAVAAGVELTRGSLEEAEHYVQLATRKAPSVAADRREGLELTLALLRGWIARLRGDIPVAVEQSQALLAPAGASDTAQGGPGAELQRAGALLNLGIAEVWDFRREEAERHLEQGLALARRIGQPWLEIQALGHLAIITAAFESAEATCARCARAIELAGRHGWANERVVALPYILKSWTLAWQGRSIEAAQSLERGERALRPEVEPLTGVILETVRGMLAIAGGCDEEALSAFRAATRLAELVVPAHRMSAQIRAFELHTIARLGDATLAEAALGAQDAHERDPVKIRVDAAVAAVWLSRGDAKAATDTLAAALEGRAPRAHAFWAVTAFVVEANARDALGDAGAAEMALEHALDRAEPDGLLWPFLLHPVPGLLERHRRHRTTHASLISEILSMLSGRKPVPAGEATQSLREPLSEAETRILRYLPTNLSKQEIASEVYLSVNTVKAHTRHLYEKLGVHSRAEAVERARGLGLLAPSLRGR